MGYNVFHLSLIKMPINKNCLAGKYCCDFSYRNKFDFIHIENHSRNERGMRLTQSKDPIGKVILDLRNFLRVFCESTHN